MNNRHMSSNENTQLTTMNGFNVNRIVFGKYTTGSVPNSAVPISFGRMNILVKNPDGTVGDLIIPSCPSLFSFGVGENVNPETNKVNGYSLPLCLWNRDNPTDQEREWVVAFDSIVEYIKNYILEHKSDIGKYDLEAADLRRFNPMYWKKDKGVKVEGVGPTLYPKLIQSKKADKILSIFCDQSGNELNPLDLIGKYCTVNSAIKIESVFVGNKISLQVKLYEAEVRLLQTGMKRLVCKQTPDPVVSVGVPNGNPSDFFDQPEDDFTENTRTEETSNGSLSRSGSDTEPDNDQQAPKPAPKKVIRKAKK